MAPKKESKDKKTVAGKNRGNEAKKGDGKNDAKNKDQKNRSKVPKCKTPLAQGTVMAQRRLAPTFCCPSQGATVRCCLPRPGCWPY